MFRILTCIKESHDPFLVILAIGVCLSTSAIMVALSQRASAASESCSRITQSLVLQGCISGTGIWATHFIAILAYLPVTQTSFNPWLTAASYGLATAFTIAGVSINQLDAKAWYIPLSAGAAIGLAIVSMHFCGMAALNVNGRIIWDAPLIGMSVIAAFAFAIASFYMARLKRTKFNAAAAAGLLALAVASHHFIAMAALQIEGAPEVLHEGLSLQPDFLAMLISVITFAVLSVGSTALYAQRRMAIQTSTFNTAFASMNFHLDIALNNMSQGLSMFDQQGRLVVCNNRYAEMYALPDHLTRAGTLLADILADRVGRGAISTAAAASYLRLRLGAMSSGQPFAEIRTLADGRSVSIVDRPIPSGGWVSTHEDVTERKKAEDRIAFLARHDFLTGLPNRTCFTEKFDEYAAAGLRFSVLFIDIDHFKTINDVFGHAGGDTFLRALAQRFQSVAGEAFLARHGGDEFVMIQIEDETGSVGKNLAARLQASIADEISIGGRGVQAAMSLGVGTYPKDGSTIDAFLNNVDAALFRAKREGRGTARFFDPDLDIRSRDHLALEMDLQNAAERNELGLVYQPLLRMNGDIIGFESLVRWHHSQKGLISPADFIPIAEETGLILKIDEWVLREACREASTWSNALQVAVNISALQFRCGNLPNLVHEILLESGLEPHRLELEITEGCLIDDFSRASSILRQLKALGVGIAMDDFGTGYSSLSYLHAFPFDKIKLDRSFVSNLETSAHSRVISKAVISLAHALDLSILAEGVENEAQHEFLRSCECDFMQGYLFGRPQDIQAFSALVHPSQGLRQAPDAKRRSA